MKPMARVARMALLLSLTGMLAAAAGAQDLRGRFEVTPYIGALVPTNDVVAAGDIASGSPAAKHETSLLFGGKLTYWFGDAIGLEADIAFSPSALESDAFGIAGTVDADFFVADARIVQAFGRDASSVTLLLSGGIGFFATSYDQLDMKTGGLGVLGIGVRLPLGGVALQFELEDYISTTDWELRDGSTTTRAMQNDLRFSAGLVLPLVR